MTKEANVFVAFEAPEATERPADVDEGKPLNTGAVVVVNFDSTVVGNDDAGGGAVNENGELLVVVEPNPEKPANLDVAGAWKNGRRERGMNSMHRDNSRSTCASETHW